LLHVGNDGGGFAGVAPVKPGGPKSAVMDCGALTVTNAKFEVLDDAPPPEVKECGAVGDC
jgi:hypothetical protein